MKPKLLMRRGTLMQDALVAVGMASVIVVIVGQLVSVSSRQWFAAQQRLVAVREAGNAMEQIISRPWAEMNAEKLNSLDLARIDRDVLPEAKLSVAVDPVESDANGVRIRVQLDWRNPAGQRGVPVELVAWRYRNGE